MKITIWIKTFADGRLVIVMVMVMVVPVGVRLPVSPGENILLGGAGPLQPCPAQNLCSHLFRSLNEIVVPGKAMINTILISHR